MRRVVLVLVPVLVAAGVLAAASPASAQHPGAEGMITYVDEATWSATQGPDGRPRACCTPSLPDPQPNVAADHVVWGPDGRTVAVVGTWTRDGGPGTPELLVHDLVGDTLRSLGAADASRPDISPDGTQVVLARGGDIVVVDLATGALVRQLTSTPAVERDPSWSADGSRVAFASPAGVSIVPSAGGDADLVLPGASAPQFSGDGRSLAYLSVDKLWVARADGGDPACTGLPAYGFTWSPDSTKLVALLDLTLLDDSWQSNDVWIVTAAGAQVAPGPGGPATTSLSWQPVPAPEPGVVAPAAAVNGAAAAFARSTSLPVRWTATDALSTVTGTDVRYRRWGALGGAPSSFRWWVSGSGARAATLEAAPGHRYCFSTRARNEAGAVSGWSAEKCSVVPFDDRGLATTGTWARVSRTGFLRGTATRTSERYAALTGPTGYVREIGVLASTGPRAGSVAVFVGAHRVGTISLVSATPRDRALLTLPRLATGRYGTIRLVVVSSGRTVRIDGLAASAW